MEGSERGEGKGNPTFQRDRQEKDINGCAPVTTVVNFDTCWSIVIRSYMKRPVATYSIDSSLC